MLNYRLDVMGEAQHFEKPQKHLARERSKIQDVLGTLGWLKGAQEMDDEVPSLTQKQTPKQFEKYTATSPEEALHRPCS
ncbi:hypothetical protein TNCV_3118731 [Trichonephila clavipes]|uniref:Uncharacterized protein n=1 Tax=Trichonephila clavipes TaxID=2585209 RepID=A0A8X6W979_TRICX|nr:hypothetical protein TNCV_3118731 [Trichonephila clavipes]